MTSHEEITYVAQCLVVHNDAVDLEAVQAEWHEYQTAPLMYEARKFIDLHDALAAFRAKPADPPALTEAQEDDLDLVERTPHAMRGEKWLQASIRLDKAGIKYTPGGRYNQPTPQPPAHFIGMDLMDTKEDLEDLPPETVIVMGLHGNEPRARVKDKKGMWVGTGADQGYSAVDSAYIIHWYRKATVLFTPSQPVRP